MEFEIHEVCHTYSQLLGIDTVHVKVFIVLCNIKQFVLFRRGTFYKNKNKQNKKKQPTHHILFEKKKKKTF